MYFDPRYIIYLLGGAVVSLIFAVAIWARNGELDIGWSLFCFFSAVGLTSLVTIRLPVFRQYYQARTLEEFSEFRGMANMKAAHAMSMIIAWGVLAAGLHFIGVPDPGLLALVGAVAAPVISCYHD